MVHLISYHEQLFLFDDLIFGESHKIIIQRGNHNTQMQRNGFREGIITPQCRGMVSYEQTTYFSQAVMLVGPTKDQPCQINLALDLIAIKLSGL